MTTTEPKILLVDMDNTIADTDKALVAAGMSCADVYARTSFEFTGDLEAEAKRIMSQPGFFLNLEPLDGAIKTLKQLEAKHGYTVFFATSPFNSLWCMQEKRQWIGKHFNTVDGDEDKATANIKWQDRLIQSKDKTVLVGRVLIDDHPDMGAIDGKSAMQPIWKHVLFSKTYNVKSSKPRIACWRIEHVVKVLENV